MNAVPQALRPLLIAILMLPACHSVTPTVAPPLALTPAPASDPGPGPAARWVKLPHRAAWDAMDELSPDYFNGAKRKLTRFLGPRGRELVGSERLDLIVGEGFMGDREVLESDTFPFYRVWFSFRPHYAAQHTAFVVSRENEILAVANVHVDCPPEDSCDPFEPMAVHIYVPKGKATPDRIEPLRHWVKSEDIWAPGPEQIIELP